MGNVEWCKERWREGDGDLWNEGGDRGCLLSEGGIVMKAMKCVLRWWECMTRVWF